LQRAFLTIGDRQLHYRAAGVGTPVVMLHPSPLSSAAVMPMGRALARHFRVYAFDTPGYGQSEPPASRPASLDDYLPDFAAALDALGLARICLYGAATGAQFAIEFARRYPERVALVVLDSAGHIAADECERVVRDYFPDVTPRGDGSHLATLWQMVRDLGVFFPWCDRRAARRIARDLAPPEALQSMLLDYLRAGERYDWAYRPAFYNERAERAHGVTLPSQRISTAGTVTPWARSARSL
jgi:pimeloyl-ACP methyl ester carboxylesterase